MLDVIAKSYKYEKSHFAMWCGFYTFFTSTVLYAFLTVGITTGVTNKIKQLNGLK
jgi:hypothetical protein